MCRFYYQTRCPRPWNCPKALSQDYWAHWLLPCDDLPRCPVWIEREERQVEEMDFSDMKLALEDVSAQARTAIDALEESDFRPLTTIAQIQENDERLQEAIDIRDRMLWIMRDLKAIQERTRTRRFVWEALAGMPWYPARVIAAMIFQEYLADLPWQFPVLVLW